jgi:hypothetical protein
MALTRNFKQTVIERVERDPQFAKALLDEAATLFLSGEPETARLIESEIVPTTLMVDDLLWDIQSRSKDQWTAWTAWTAWSAACGLASGENFAARPADEQSVRIVSTSGKESRYCVRFRTMSLKRYLEGYAEHRASDVVPTCSCGR